MEFQAALDTLVSEMLKKRKLYPRWETVTSWFSINSVTLRAIRELVNDARLCRISEDKLTFRHDRLLHELLVGHVSDMVSSADWDEDLLADPYFSEIVGKALLRSGAESENVDRLVRLNVVALFEALRYAGNNTPETVVTQCVQWAREQSLKPENKSVVNAISWSLVGTDSKTIFEITEHLPSNWLILLAKLRNGSGADGAKAVAADGPTPRFPFRDRLIEHAKYYHADRLKGDLRGLLRDETATDDIRRGYLQLAGFFGWNELLVDVAACWELAENKEAILSDALWAVMQCCCGDEEQYLDPLLDIWEKLSDTDDGSGMNPRYRIAEETWSWFCREIPDSIPPYLVAAAKKREPLRWLLTIACAKIGSPDSVEFLAQEAARYMEKNEKAFISFHPFCTAWDPKYSGGRELSLQSMDKLRVLWSEPSSRKHLKRFAFRLWVAGTTREHLPDLQAVRDDVLRDEALQHRARLRDRTVVPELRKLLDRDPHWVQFADYVWDESFEVGVERHLQSLKDNTPRDFSGGSTNTHYFCANLIMLIPRNVAERLVLKYWDFLRYSPLFVCAALHIGTGPCKEVADKAIQECPSKTEIFRLFSGHFGFKDSRKQHLLRRDHIAILAPYLPEFPDHSQSDYGDLVVRFGMVDWLRTNISSEKVSERFRKEFLPTEDDVRQFLSDMQKVGNSAAAAYWLGKKDKDGILSNMETRRVLETILEECPTIETFRFIADCVDHLGRRALIEVLNPQKIESKREEAVLIKQNVSFSVARRSLE